MDECEDCSTLYLIIFIFCILPQAKFVLVLILCDAFSYKPVILIFERLFPRNPPYCWFGFDGRLSRAPLVFLIYFSMHGKCRVYTQQGRRGRRLYSIKCDAAWRNSPSDSLLVPAQHNRRRLLDRPVLLRRRFNSKKRRKEEKKKKTFLLACLYTH